MNTRKKLALVFPGQGSQFVGMGNELKSNFPEVYRNFDLASKKLGFNLSTLCSEGPAEKLKQTEYTQPAIVTHSYSLYQVLHSKVLQNLHSVSCVLGHSVGEYSALLAAKTLTFEDAVSLVHQRGLYMKESSAEALGGMAAIVGPSQEYLQEACQQVSSSQNAIVVPANFNSPKQIVVSGNQLGLQSLKRYLDENPSGTRCRFIELPVSAAFHSPLMKKAASCMEALLRELSISPNEVPYISNYDASLNEAKTQATLIKEKLVHQIDQSVLWTQSIEKLGADYKYIEVGPGKVLTGLIKQISPGAEVFTFDSPEKLEDVHNFITN